MVLGCDVAYDTVCDILEATDCQVFHGMKCKGVLDAMPRFQLPGNISLDMIRVTPVARSKED